MKFFFRFWICIFLFPVLFLRGEALSAEGSFIASLDRSEITLEETATLVLSLKAKGEGKSLSPPVIPKIAGLLVFYRETRSVLSPQGGEVSQAQEFVYTLLPETAGAKVIPALGIHADGRLFTTEPLTLKVIAPDVERRRTFPDRSQYVPPPSRSLKKQEEAPFPKAFARLVVDRLRPYLYEPIRITLWVYATVPFQYGGIQEDPNLKGFAQIKDLEGQFIPAEETTEIREGEIFRGKSVQEQIWYAYESGKKELKLGEVKLLLRTEARDLFDRSFQETLPAGPFGSHAEPLNLPLEPILFEVQPLPESDRPENFSNAVGDFSVHAKLDKTDIKSGDSVTFSVHLRGKGNLKASPEFSLQRFPFATTFRPRTTDKYRLEKTALGVERTYEVILITNREGEQVIPPFSFSYFSPKFRTYRKVETEPIHLNIAERVKPVSGEEIEEEALKQLSPELVGKDVYFLKKELGPVLAPQGSLLKNPIFWGLQSLPPFILILALFWRFYHSFLYRHEALFRKRRAFQSALTRLKKAEIYLRQRRMQEFAEEAQDAVMGYLGDKTGLAEGALSLERIDSLIAEGGGDEATRLKVRVTLEGLQAIRFASFGAEETPHVSIETLQEVLRQLEQIHFPTVSV